jgi:hypothetical protein
MDSQGICSECGEWEIFVSEELCESCDIAIYGHPFVDIS